MRAAFAPVESEFGLHRQFVVEEWAILVVNRTHGATEHEWENVVFVVVPAMWDRGSGSVSVTPRDQRRWAVVSSAYTVSTTTDSTVT